MTMGNTILCGFLFGVWMLAIPARSEGLKAYYEKQKAEIKSTFVAPKLESKIGIILLDGQKHIGLLKKLTDTTVQIESAGTMLTFRKDELSERSCAMLFSEDYAHAKAIVQTRAYKASQSRSKLITLRKGALSVVATVKKDSNRKDKNIEIEDSSTHTEVRSRSKIKNLEIMVSNRTSHPDSYLLEWYFFKQDVNGTHISIHSQGEEEFELQGLQRIKHKVVSKKYTVTKTTINMVYSGRSSALSNLTQRETGEEEKGYLVVLKCGDEVLDRKDSNKKYLDTEWIKAK